MAEIIWDHFSPDEQASIREWDLARIPRHIAIIMDGNGRWATEQGLPRVVGHRAGSESVRAAVRACRALGVQYLTLYSFSIENWSRPEGEVSALMALIEDHLRKELGELHEEGVRIRHLGRRDGLPASMLDALDTAEAQTRHNPGLHLCIAINYSGRAELTDAARRLAHRARAGELDPAALTEADLAGALYLPDVPDPDLLIRTAGELRVSNYLLWQIAYTEFYATPDYWPRFRARHLIEAITEYQHRQRKFGRVPS